jgi:hypothetical protein
MRVIGAHPRIYVRASESFTVPPPIAPADMWTNVEVTFYAYATGASEVPWAGIAAAVKTNHWPDSWQCTSGGYVARMRFDGRVDFVKELYHEPNTTFYAGEVLGSWTPDTGSVEGRLPLNRWIGFKFVARNVRDADSGSTHVLLQLYRDLSVGSSPSPDPPEGGGQVGTRHGVHRYRLVELGQPVHAVRRARRRQVHGCDPPVHVAELLRLPSNRRNCRRHPPVLRLAECP